MWHGQLQINIYIKVIQIVLVVPESTCQILHLKKKITKNFQVHAINTVLLFTTYIQANLILYLFLGNFISIHPLSCCVCLCSKNC